MSDTSDVGEDFLNALALLHSTEDDSAEKLRKMLDATIERKYGADKTLQARMPMKFLNDTKIRGKSYSNEKLEKRDDVVSRKRGNTLEKTVGNLSFFTNNATESSWKSVKIYNTEIEDYSEKGDIPRISIPDEGSGDGLLCKICNGAKLGPLILLECQECQEVYHPLCHQPPVVDIDVYDPRIVWHCRKCTDTFSASSATAFDEKKLKKYRSPNDAGKLTEAFVKASKSKRMDTNLSKDESNFGDQGLTGGSQRNGGSVENASSVKDSPYLIQKAVRTLSTNQLRKRIGSKLSVTRSTVK